MCYDKQSDIDIHINRKLTVLGGDLRSLAAAEKFIRRAFKVTLCGFSGADAYPKGAVLSSSAERAIAEADILLLPLPVSRDGVHVYCPMDNSASFELDRIPHSIKSNALVFGGKIPEALKKSISERGIFCYDYYDDPTLALLNAHISAEGALMYAMEATDTAMIGRNIAIIGYGRIAQRLCRLCRAFGANVTVFARRAEVRTQAILDGAGASELSADSLRTLTHGFDIIFNTVPARIMTPQTVASLPAETLYIELASTPFGIDAADARRSSAKVIWASSIPGKYAPVTAGEIIADTVREEIERRGGKEGDLP